MAISKTQSTYPAHLTKPHFCCRVYRAYLSYLRLHHPEVNLEQLCLDAGLPLSYLEDESRWVSIIFDEAFTRLAIERSGEPDLCFRVGAHAMTQPALGSLFYLIVNRIMPLHLIYQELPRLTSLFSKVTRFHSFELRSNDLIFDFGGVAEGLDSEELGALERNFENIFQNTMGYYCTVPVHRRLPQAQIESMEGSSKLLRRVHLRFESPGLASRAWAPLIPIACSLALPFIPFSLTTLELALALSAIWLSFGYVYYRESRTKFDQAIRTIQQLDQRYEQLFKSKEEIRRLSESYSRFVPWQVLELLNLKSPIEMQLGQSVTRVLTVMFLDIRNFSSMVERWSPQETMLLVNEFFSRTAPCIRQHQGFIDHYTGDGAMAIFPNRPDDALKAALEIQRALQAYNQERKSRGQAPIRAGIGINTGRITLGLVGYEHQFQATALSDVVNTASRLEAHTKKIGKDILLGGLCYELLETRTDYVVEDLGEILLPGKEQPIRTYALLSASRFQLEPLTLPIGEPSEAVTKIAQPPESKTQVLPGARKK